MKSLVGQTLGAYRILEQIGRGGMATVFKAYQPALDRYVAVKVLPPHLADERGFTQRFRREARAVAQLEHPHILAVYDSGQEGGLSYLVMRFVEAGTLKAQMGLPLDLERVTDLISQISEALDYAHEKGIVHRDIKPSNILMDREDWALLSDFGLAKMMEGSQQITETGVGLGTPDYMSPEQGMAERVDQRSDIYSLGVVLYEMLTGRVPYKADTPMAVVLKHIHDPLPLPREVNPEIPEAIERVVLKAMAKDPRDRFERARDLAEALRETSKGIELSRVGLTPTSASSAPETPEDAPAPRFAKRVRSIVWMLPVTLAIVALGFVFTRIPIRVQIVGGRLEIVSSEQGVQSIEPTAELTRVPTVESTDLASEGALGEEGPMMAATYAPDAPIYGDFEGQGGFDDSRWAISALSPPECVINQLSGVAMFSNQPSDEALVCILLLLERSPVPFEHLGFVEAEFYAVGDSTGGLNNQYIAIFTEDVEGEYWIAQCGLGWDGGGQYSAFSNVHNLGRDQESEKYYSVPVDSQTWYRLRLEVDPESGEFNCFLDDRLVDRYIPRDSEQLRDAQFFPSIVGYRTPGSVGTFWADNLRISELVSVRNEEVREADDGALVRVFGEDFEDGEMKAFSQMTGIWRIVDDGSGSNKVLESLYGVRNRWSHIEFGPVGFSDGAIEYRVRIIDFDPTKEDSGKTSLQFRAASWGDSAYSVDLNPYFRNLTLAYGGPYLSNQWEGLGEVQMEIRRDRWYLIRVEIQGSQMSVFLDGVKLIVGNDARLKPAGRFAFNVDRDAYVQFDDIQVFELVPPRAAATTATLQSVLPTGTPRPISQATLSPAQILLHDNFDDPSYYRGYNTSLWICTACAEGSVTQEDGSVRFEINTIGSLGVQSRFSWPWDQIRYIQARLKISEYQGADNGDLHLVLGSNLSSGWWQAFCYIEGRQSWPTQLAYTCSVVTVDLNGVEKYEYFSDSVPVSYGEWYTTKIQLNPDTFELQFYLHDQLIGQHTPADADELAAKSLKVHFGVSSNNISRHIVANVDEVLIVQAP